MAKKALGQLSRSELWTQLANAIALRSSQDQVLWSIFGVFWAANAILFVALFTTGKIPVTGVGMIISFIGIFMSITWYLIQRRALGWIGKHEALIRLIDSLLFQGLSREAAIINDVDYKKFLGRGPTARHVMQWCTGIFIFIWVLLFFAFAYLAYTSGTFQVK